LHVSSALLVTLTDGLQLEPERLPQLNAEHEHGIVEVVVDDVVVVLVVVGCGSK
jgi:hypothetical protein